MSLSRAQGFGCCAASGILAVAGDVGEGVCKAGVSGSVAPRTDRGEGSVGSACGTTSCSGTTGGGVAVASPGEVLDARASGYWQSQETSERASARQECQGVSHPAQIEEGSVGAVGGEAASIDVGRADREAPEGDDPV